MDVEISLSHNLVVCSDSWSTHKDVVNEEMDNNLKIETTIMIDDNCSVKCHNAHVNFVTGTLEDTVFSS